jgi:hypothetical protein
MTRCRPKVDVGLQRYICLGSCALLVLIFSRTEQVTKTYQAQFRSDSIDTSRSVNARTAACQSSAVLLFGLHIHQQQAMLRNWLEICVRLDSHQNPQKCL